VPNFVKGTIGSKRAASLANIEDKIRASLKWSITPFKLIPSPSVLRKTFDWAMGFNKPWIKMAALSIEW
jgi:hypothetical protein